MTFAESALPQNLLTLLRQPTAIAVLASLGLHGLVWAGSPFIQFEDSTATGPLTVGVVQLTPEELQRLPQDATALQNPALTPLTPSTLGFEGSLPPIPALPPPPNDIFGTLPSLESLNSLPSNSEFLPPIPLGELPAPPVSNPWVTVNPNELPDFAPVPLPPEQIPLSGDNFTLPNFPAAIIPDPPLLDPTVGQPNLTEPDPAAPLQPPTPRPIPQAAIDRLRELQRMKAENPGTTLDPTLPQQAQDWLARGGGIPPRKLILEGYTYPKSVCPKEGYVTVTTLVNGQGAVVDSEVTKSSEVPELDQVALNFAKSYAYPQPPDGQPRAYWSPFDFKNSACSAAAPTETPARPEAQPPEKPPEPAITPASSSPVPQASPSSTIEASPAPEPSPVMTEEPTPSAEPALPSEPSSSPTSEATPAS